MLCINRLCEGSCGATQGFWKLHSSVGADRQLVPGTCQQQVLYLAAYTACILPASMLSVKVYVRLEAGVHRVGQLPSCL